MFYVTLFGDNPFKSYIEINLSIALTHFWFSNIRFPELLGIIIALARRRVQRYNMFGKFLSSGVAPSDALQTDYGTSRLTCSPYLAVDFNRRQNSTAGDSV